MRFLLCAAARSLCRLLSHSFHCWGLPCLMSSEWQDNGRSSFAVLPWHNFVILCKFFLVPAGWTVCSDHRNRRHSLDGAPGASKLGSNVMVRVWKLGVVAMEGDGYHYANAYTVSLASLFWLGIWIGPRKVGNQFTIWGILSIRRVNNLWIKNVLHGL